LQCTRPRAGPLRQCVARRQWQRAGQQGGVLRSCRHAEPGCRRPERCFYFNPFGSSFPNNKNFGQPNPRYVPGAENSAELSARLYDDRQLEEQSQNLTIDALVSGGSPFNLPGGEIAWAAGAQWRQSEERKSTTGPFLDEDKFPRSWPGQQVGNVGCPSQDSPYFFFNTENFDPTDQQQYSYFGDLQVPVLENLSLQLAVRREEFPQPDLSPTVYKIAGKWEPLAWLAIRGSHGTNYATPPANLTPGDLEAALALVASAGNKFLRVETETLPGVKPETAKVTNLGVIFTFDNRMPMDGALRINLDYFDFRIEDEIKTVSHNAILNSTFLDPARLGRNELINCNASLIERITFINGKGSAGCAQGVTTGDSVTGIRSVYGNGPGIKTPASTPT
jgi:iron complex outermembrane receptor protein